MNDETVMQAVDRELADAGLHAVTPGSVERLVAEVERLRAERDDYRDAFEDLTTGEPATAAGVALRVATEQRDEARAEVERLRAAARAAYGIVVGTHTDERGAVGEHCQLCSFAFDDQGECGCPGDLIRGALRAAIEGEGGNDGRE